MSNEEQINCKSCSKTDYTRIDTARFISRLDGYYEVNDLEGAGRHLEYWEAEARRLGDLRGLLTILNEELGFCRRTSDTDQADRVSTETEKLLNQIAPDGLSGAVIYVNLATTLSAFGNYEKSLVFYETADELYHKMGAELSYEYAALLNNKASALTGICQTDDAEKCINKAVEILKKIGDHDGEIALSLVTLAHLTYDRDETAVPEVEKILDDAWEFVNSSSITRDSKYAFVLTKCAPSFRYFKREMEALAMEEVAKEIYGRRL